MLTRRWIMPLVVLVIGCAIAYWASIRQAQHIREIHTMVTALCSDAAAGKNLSGKLNPENLLVESRVIEALRDLCPKLDEAAGARINVRRGDYRPSADVTAPSPPASHTAVLRAPDGAGIALRIHYDGDRKSMRVLGFWAIDEQNSEF